MAIYCPWQVIAVVKYFNYIIPFKVMGHRRTGAFRQHDARLLQGGRRRLHRLRRHEGRHLRGRREMEKRSRLKSFASGR